MSINHIQLVWLYDELFIILSEEILKIILYFSHFKIKVVTILNLYLGTKYFVNYHDFNEFH